MTLEDRPAVTTRLAVCRRTLQGRQTRFCSCECKLRFYRLRGRKDRDHVCPCGKYGREFKLGGPRTDRRGLRTMALETFLPSADGETMPWLTQWATEVETVGHRGSAR